MMNNLSPNQFQCDSSLIEVRCRDICPCFSVIRSEISEKKKKRQRRQFWRYNLKTKFKCVLLK